MQIIARQKKSDIIILLGNWPMFNTLPCLLVHLIELYCHLLIFAVKVLKKIICIWKYLVVEHNIALKDYASHNPVNSNLYARMIRSKTVHLYEYDLNCNTLR